MKEKSSMKEKMRSERHKPLAAQILSDQRVKARAHKQPKQRSRQEEKEVSGDAQLQMICFWLPHMSSPLLLV
jgi:hypothetical protein